jgi:hypothetical protein
MVILEINAKLFMYRALPALDLITTGFSSWGIPGIPGIRYPFSGTGQVPRKSTHISLNHVYKN